MSEIPTVQCPYCKEEVRADAILCKHCRSELSPQIDQKSEAPATCFNCHSTLPYGLERCPYCDIDLSDESREELSRREEEEEAVRHEKRFGRAVIWSILIVVGITGVLAFMCYMDMCSFHLDDDNVVTPEEFEKHMGQSASELEDAARNAARTLIEKVLVSPASADYLKEDIIDRSGRYYFVHMVVDAKNAFGTPLRESICVIVELHKDDISQFTYHREHGVLACTNPPTDAEIVAMQVANKWPE